MVCQLICILYVDFDGSFVCDLPLIISTYSVHVLLDNPIRASDSFIMIKVHQKLDDF